MDLSKYTEESAQAVRIALVQAKAVKDNRNATEDEVKEAEKMLQTAMDGLQVKADASITPNHDGDNKKDEHPVKTGDDVQPVLPMAGVLAAVLGILLTKKKK
ncbi:MAG: LPXTG cell wall anchor domain-containing protein [Clostridiales bacterium]|nr:LPXTG cell wall anchor domain-containing protein [Clostridiales bacterium]